jgi:transcriptional regulator with XRE-family HTH domain
MPRKPPGKSKHLDEAFRAELTALRLAKDWTQDELAARSGYTQAFLSRIEKGSQTPSVTALLNIIDALGKSPDVYWKAVVRRTNPKPAKKSAQ